MSFFDSHCAWLILILISCVEINVAIIAACMSTLPGVLAQAKRFGSTVYKSLLSRMRGSRSGSTSATSKGSEKTGSNTGGDFTAPASRKKTVENINYIQLEDGAQSKASTERLSNSDNQPLWGRP